MVQNTLYNTYYVCKVQTYISNVTSCKVITISLSTKTIGKNFLIYVLACIRQYYWESHCILIKLCVDVFVPVNISGWLYHCTCTWMHVHNDKAKRRDALQLLVPSDDAQSSSDRCHLPCLNLNLAGCGMSNSLRTNGICQPTSKLFFTSVLAITKGFKCSPTPASQLHVSSASICIFLLKRFYLLMYSSQRELNIFIPVTADTCTRATYHVVDMRLCICCCKAVDLGLRVSVS